jgi:hypothetical protein
MRYITLVTLAIAGFLVAGLPSPVTFSRQAQAVQTQDRERNSIPPSQVLCSATVGLKPDSWEYREAMARCRYGSN